MGSLFGGEDDIRQSQAAQQAYAQKATKRALRQIDPAKVVSLLDAERPRLTQGVTDAQAQAAQGIANAQSNIAGYLGLGGGLISSERDRLASLATQLQGGLKPVDYRGPGYGIQINNDGTIAMNRTGEAQGFIDKLLAGMATDDEAFGGLLSQITPGFGKLTEARKKDIEDQARSATGNLREQLARRKVLGASFAEDQVRGLQAQYDKMRDQAIAESTIEELKMTGEVITSRTNARQQAIATGLSQIQFEGNIGAELTAQVSSSLQQLQQMQLDVAKLSAAMTEMGVDLTKTGLAADTQLAQQGVQTGADLAKLGVAGSLDLSQSSGQLTSAGQIARGNIAGNIGNTVVGSFPQYAQLQQEAAAGPWQLGGTLLGAAMTGGSGGAAGGSLLGNLLS